MTRASLPSLSRMAPGGREGSAALTVDSPLKRRWWSGGRSLSLDGDRRFAEIRALAAKVQAVRRAEPEPEPGA